MLLRHSASYLLARGVPGVITFLSIAIYTRLLSPEEYGFYALVMAGVGLLNMILFQWIRLSVVRFLPKYIFNPDSFKSTILYGYMFVSCISVGICLILLLFNWEDPIWYRLIPVGVALLLVQGWFEINLEFPRARLMPMKYGFMAGLKATLGLVLGVIFIFFIGWGAIAPLVGLLFAMLTSALIFGYFEWNNIKPKIDKEIFPEILKYAIPLTATFALSYINSTADRLLIAGMINESAAGIYSVGYDLSRHTITLLMVIISLAANPLAINALEERGEDAAKKQVAENAIIIFAISFPATILFIVLASNIGNIFVGSDFREESILILPIISVVALFAGMKAYYFDMAFHLSKKTSKQIWIVGVSSVINLILNILLIPQFGILGAAYATLISYIVGIVLSIWVGNNVFKLPIPYREFIKIVLAGAVFGGVMWFFSEPTQVYSLLYLIPFYILFYLLVLLLLNTGNSRLFIFEYFKNLRSNEK